MENESVERIEKAEGAGGQQVNAGPSGMEPPLEDYDGLNVRQATERLDSLSGEELERVRSYELEHKNRKTLLAELDKRLTAVEEQGSVIEEPGERPAAEEQQETLSAEPAKEPGTEQQQDGGIYGAWFSAYRNWILAAVGAVVLLMLLF